MHLIHKYALLGETEKVAEQLKEEDINVRSEKTNSTPLLCAVQEGRYNTVKFLLANGANIYAHDKSGYTCLHIAFVQIANKKIEQKNKEIFYKIIEMILRKEVEKKSSDEFGGKLLLAISSYNILSVQPLDIIDNGKEKQRILEIIERVKHSSNSEQDQSEVLLHEHAQDKKAAATLIHRRQKRDNHLSSEKDVTDKTPLMDGNPKQNCIIL